MLLVILLVLMIADAVTTYIALDKGAHEANPVIALLMRQIGVVPALVVIKAVGAVGAVAIFYLAPEVLTFIAIAVYALVVIHNIKVIQK